jgi:hypothetical protein
MAFLVWVMVIVVKLVTEKNNIKYPKKILFNSKTLNKINYPMSTI